MGDGESTECRISAVRATADAPVAVSTGQEAIEHLPLEMAPSVQRAPKFSEAEIELAQLFKAYGLDWSPAPGHYVLDQSELIECGSPFQGRVFFILDLRHFLRRCGTLAELKQRMCWLPDWDDARQILRELSVDARVISERLQMSRAIESGTERLELYRLIEESLTETLDG